MAGYDPNTYDWYQCDEEDYNPFDPPEEMATEPMWVDEECECETDDLEYDAVVAAARMEDEALEYAAIVRGEM